MLNYQCGERLAEINTFKLDQDENYIINSRIKPKIVFINEKEYTCCQSCTRECSLDNDICCKSCSRVLYHLIPRKEINFVENNDIVLPENQKFQILPTNQINSQPDAIYISGGAGLGKSFWVAQYLTEFKKLYKNKKVFLFSRKKEDKLLDKLIDKRIDCSKILDLELNADDFQGQCVIFDDTDTLPNSKKEPIKDLIYKLIEDILEVGRSLGITVIMTSHIIANGNESKRILNRSNKIVLFKKGLNKNANYFLSEYMGFPSRMIKKIKSLDTRAICILKAVHPYLIMGDRHLFQIELE